MSYLARKNKNAQPCKKRYTKHLIKCKLLPPNFWSEQGNVFTVCPTEEGLKQLREPTQVEQECILAYFTISVNDLKEYKATEKAHRSSD